MTKPATILAFAAFALAAALPAFAGNTPGVDDAYRITGDSQAAPIQAFSVGSALYLQLQNVHAVPAPIGPSGPIPYRIYGPYIVLPVMPQVTLHYGQWTAYVTATDAPAQASVSSTMTRPVDALHPTVTPSPSLPPPSPVAVPPTYNPYVGSAATAISTDPDTVTGQITGAGQPAAGFQPAGASRNPGPLSAPAGQGGELLAQLPSPPHGIVQIVADGTVAGAKAADQTMQSCISRRWACRVQYTGAPAGQVQLETIQ